MRNEIMLIATLIFINCSVLAWYRLFGTKGLYCFSIFATITANIEVLMVVRAFGIDQTLGNILFASTFLITDIISELEGKKEANKVVNINIMTSIMFILVSQGWLHYIPSESDWARESVEIIFRNTPRLMLVSLLVYAVTQKFDVWLYHKWWDLTAKKSGDGHRFLWIRNNFSTLVSQFINTILFTVGAFAGMYEIKTLISITISSYAVYIVTSLADTPIIYIARHWKEKGIISN